MSEDCTEVETWIRPGMTTSCVVWKRGKGSSGYGYCYDESGKQKKAHRVAWEQACGKIPDALMVLHKCDNRPCVNPEHLFLGTQLDNMRDMYAKGRNGYSGHIGERHPNVNFTSQQVLTIRELFSQGNKINQIRRDFGGSYSAIHHIVTRHTWKHL